MQQDQPQFWGICSGNRTTRLSDPFSAMFSACTIIYDFPKTTNGKVIQYKLYQGILTYFVAIFAKKNLKNKKKLKHFDSDQLYKTKMIDLSEKLGMFAQRKN